MTTGLPRLHFDSRPLPATERFDRWRAAVGKVYELSAPGYDGAGELQVNTSIWNLGSLLLSDNRFGSRFQRRSARSIRSDQVDHYRLLLQTGGSLNIDADGRRETLSAGRLILTDLARPETYATEAGSNIVLFVPRELLDDALPQSLDLHGVALTGGCAALLSEHMRALVRNAGLLTASELPALNQATVSLLAASIAASSQALAQARPAMEVTLLRQACRYVDLHLTDAELSAEEICRFFKLSRATLYRLFEPYGGVARYIKERRLLRVHALLASATQRQHLGRLADDYGFKTATHFSRAFREQFGYSPGEVRQVRREAPVVQQGEVGYDGFNQWLRALRD
jgi:AraC-like DNA-binding protein